MPKWVCRMPYVKTDILIFAYWNKRQLPPNVFLQPEVMLPIWWKDRNVQTLHIYGGVQFGLYPSRHFFSHRCWNNSDFLYNEWAMTLIWRGNNIIMEGDKYTIIGWCSGLFFLGILVCVCWCAVSILAYVRMSLKADQPETFRENGEVSMEELLIAAISPRQCSPVLALLFYVTWYPNERACLYFVWRFAHLVGVLLSEIPHHPQPPLPPPTLWLCLFEFLRMEWQQDKCTELWRTNPGKQSFQNAKPVIWKNENKTNKQKTSGFQKKNERQTKGGSLHRWRKDGKEYGQSRML